MASCRHILMPWEYDVCSECLQNDPHAIRLVKVHAHCFEPQRHRCAVHIPVVIDQAHVMMEQIRPLPGNCFTFYGRFYHCCTFPDCSKGDECPFGHSKLEVDTWNAKKRIISADRSQAQEILDAGLQCQSPSKVCQVCFECNPGAVWLMWLKCTNQEEHNTSKTVRVVVSMSYRQLVKVRELPSGVSKLSELELCRISTIGMSRAPRCERGGSCRQAHSQEELNYWKWQIVNRLYAKKDPSFKSLLSTYQYPEESSEAIAQGVQCKLSNANYQSKFHMLVYLEELERSRKIIKECDSTVNIQVPPDGNLVHLTGMSSVAMDYAVLNRADVRLTLQNLQIISATATDRDYEADTLILKMPLTSAFLYSYRGQLLQNVSAHFEIARSYFQRLHQAIDFVDIDVLSKILPTKKSFESVFHQQEHIKLHGLRLDTEYQLRALKQMLSCNPAAPYLLLGPFGTGKTYVLAAAVEKLLQNSRNKVLVCTHRNRGADGLYESLQKRLGYEWVANLVLRLVPNQEGLEHVGIRSGSCLCANDPNLTVFNVSRWPTIITTFTTAIQLREMEIRSGGVFPFTHILIDEGAQCPEPETLGALILAMKETKVVIVGDNQQVGPKVAVLSNVARENGLGDSILERLFTRYKTFRKASTSHAATLLTNYRCHPSILMLASSLFYECTLLSRSKNMPHPKAPFPLVFACTSFSQDGFSNLPAENEREAEMLVKKMLEFVRQWPTWPNQPKLVVGLLASSKQQVACLRRKYHQMKHALGRRCRVEVLPTYNIQGEEFSAVFLSTSEPTDDEGKPHDPVKSICNEYVFNTVITRAQSLVFSAGNPFLLQHMGTHFKTNCWAEYIQRCIQCQSLIFPNMLNLSEEEIARLPEQVRLLSAKVFSIEELNKATSQDLEIDDAVIERYIADQQKRSEYRRSHKLVQDPRGDMSWIEEEAESGQEKVSRTDKDVVWCRIECKNYRTADAVPIDPGKPPIKLEGLGNRKAFHGDEVRVDLSSNRVLFDEETEKAMNETHFGASFLCRVDPKNRILFFPLDKRYPKFVNLPPIACREEDGVVCFDPKSINSSPRVSNFIPMECAVKMLFIVKFLRWYKRSNYPLGIIVGALPRGQSVDAGDLANRVEHGIPLSPCPLSTSLPSTVPQNTLHVFKDAFTIDPKGSPDHDDALTCGFLRRRGDSEEYQFGVHITNVQKYVPKEGELHKFALQRGCSAYRSPDNCISPMLPEELVRITSICVGKPQDTFSVLARVILRNEKVERVDSVKFVESQVTATIEMTYEEAHAIMLSSHLPHSINSEMVQYNSSQLPGKSPLKKKLQVLWKAALFLRYQRLGEAAGCFLLDEPGKELYIEAHLLIEEMMIWANHHVAKRLLKTFPKSVILRVQARPNQTELEQLVAQHSQDMSLSLGLRGYLTSEQSVPDPPNVHVLRSTLEQVTAQLQGRNIQDALHSVQFENKHPQMAVAHSLFRYTRSKTSYCKSDPGQQSYRHDSLKCDYYTHFTSPIRRFVDIATQHLLHAALNNQRCPYSAHELEEICRNAKSALKKANDYDYSIKRLVLAEQLLQSSQEYVAFVEKLNKKGALELCFSDPVLKVFRDKTIHLRHLNASEIPPEQEDSPQRERLPKASTNLTATPELPFTWKVKVASFLGSPKYFLSHPNLQLSGVAMANTPPIPYTADINVFVPDPASHLTEKILHAKITPLTCTIPGIIWKQSQACIQECLQGNDTSSLHVLQALCACHAPRVPSQVTAATQKLVDSPSPLWIYTVHRPVKTSEALHVQLSATRLQPILTPCIELLKVGPSLRVCIQHNQYPSECFVDKLTENASKDECYLSIDHYFQCWEPVVLAEAAITSLADTELLLVKDVVLKWPNLVMQIDSSGQVYYQLHIPEGKKKEGVCMELPEQFVKSSFDFFKMSAGDLACIRYDILEKDSARMTRGVFHMVIHHVECRFNGKELEAVTVYLKFVGQKSNYISPAMKKVLTSALPPRCEMQLVPLTLPYRRVYRCLHDFTFMQEGGTRLAKAIAIGVARIRQSDPPSVKTILSVEQASIATSLWPIKRRIHGSERVKVNKFQRKAIDLACSNDFVLIQGPPGTGKSVTGAHIAYALAMKLRLETATQAQSSQHEDPEEPRPCVIYCGPSQQSVNVVLDILMNSPAQKVLKIVRVFSKGIERKDFPGPKEHTGVFRHIRSDTKCSPKYRDYALHHLIRERAPQIVEMEVEFGQLHRQNKIPSIRKRIEYNNLIHVTECAVLKDGVDLILCTCNEASSHRIMKSVRPTYCIIDECAMATEPECMVPIRRADHVVLIGDHRQLQPVLSNREAEQMGLGRSLFERYVDKRVLLHMLRIQYRMHPALCEFPSREFYDRKLTTDDNVRFRSDREAHLQRFWPQGKERPFVFCNVVGREAETHTGQKGTARVGLESKYNKEEAMKIVEIAKVLIRTHKVDPSKIAALTPYSAQKEEIKIQMRHQNVNGVEVKTITESQGSEYGIVLMSTVRSRPLKDITVRGTEKKQADIGWLRGNLGFITNRHQICVGITRCKYGLVIVGNRMLLSYDDTWNRLIEHYESHGCVRECHSFP